MVMTEVVINLLEHLAEKLFYVPFDAVIPCVASDLVIQNIYLKGLSVDCTIHLLNLWLLFVLFFSYGNGERMRAKVCGIGK